MMEGSGEGFTVRGNGEGRMMEGGGEGFAVRGNGEG